MMNKKKNDNNTYGKERDKRENKIMKINQEHTYQNEEETERTYVTTCTVTGRGGVYNPPPTQAPFSRLLLTRHSLFLT